jgi:hypothetical protein
MTTIKRGIQLAIENAQEIAIEYKEHKKIHGNAISKPTIKEAFRLAKEKLYSKRNQLLQKQPECEFQCDGSSVFDLKIVDKAPEETMHQLLIGKPLFITNDNMPPTGTYVTKMLNYALWLYDFYLMHAFMYAHSIHPNEYHEIPIPRLNLSFDDFSLTLIPHQKTPETVQDSVNLTHQTLIGYTAFSKIFASSHDPDKSLYALDKLLDYFTTLANRHLHTYERVARKHFVLPVLYWKEMRLSRKDFRLHTEYDFQTLINLVEGINLLLFRFCQACEITKKRGILPNIPTPITDLAPRKSPGPKGGPRKATIERRAAIQLLAKENIKDLQACMQLSIQKIPLPSTDLQDIYQGDWRKWFKQDPDAFHKQWSKDLKSK